MSESSRLNELLEEASAEGLSSVSFEIVLKSKRSSNWTEVWRCEGHKFEVSELDERGRPTEIRTKRLAKATERTQVAALELMLAKLRK